MTQQEHYEEQIIPEQFNMILLEFLVNNPLDFWNVNEITGKAPITTAKTTANPATRPNRGKFLDVSAIPLVALSTAACAVPAAVELESSDVTLAPIESVTPPTTNAIAIAGKRFIAENPLLPILFIVANIFTSTPAT